MKMIDLGFSRPFWSPVKSGKLGMAMVGIVMTLVFWILYLHPPMLLIFLDQKVYDVMHGRISFKVSPFSAEGMGAMPKNPKGNESMNQGILQSPIIIDIDEKSLRDIGQWPWPRYRIATLFQAISDNEPSAVGIDILFPEADRTSLKSVAQSLEEYAGYPFSIERVPEALRDNDQVLAGVLQQGAFVLACQFFAEGTPSGETSRHGERSDGAGVLPRPLEVMVQSKTSPFSQQIDKDPLSERPLTDPLFPHWQKVLMPLPELTRAVAYRCGFVNAVPDSDGTIRRAPLLTQFQSRFYPSLSLMAVMEAMEAKRVTLHYGISGLVAVQVKNRKMPVFPDGTMLIHYRQGARPFLTLSASDLLTHSKDERLKGRIVFVGTSAMGLGDRHVTPMDRIYPGVFVHASIVDNILREDFISRPVWGAALESLAILVTGLLATGLLIFVAPLVCLFVSVSILLALGCGPLILFEKEHLYISMLFPFLLFFCNVTLLSFVRFRIGEKLVWQQTREMAAAQDLTLRSISGLAAKRDRETAQHVQRTARYVFLLARRLSLHPDHHRFLDAMTIEMIYKSAPLHDIGKVAVPDRILLKTGNMTEDEFRAIRLHTEHGWETIQKAEADSKIDGNSSFLKIAKDLIRYHHEKWDGTGYNHGLKGGEIPLPARLMALADVYDGVISTWAEATGSMAMDQRIAEAHDRAKKIIVESRGSHFDPDVVDAFIAESDRFKAIAVAMADDSA